MQHTIKTEENFSFCVGEKRVSQWEELMRKFSKQHEEECKAISLDIPRTYRSTKHFPTGSRYRGTWDLLGMSGFGVYTFPNEYHKGLQPAGRSNMTAKLPSRRIPPGFYDTGDGFYDPATKCVYKADDLTAILRSPAIREQKWIIENCRSSEDSVVGPKKDLYERWCEPQEKLPPVPQPAASTKCHNLSRQNSWHNQNNIYNPLQQDTSVYNRQDSDLSISWQEVIRYNDVNDIKVVPNPIKYPRKTRDIKTSMLSNKKTSNTSQNINNVRSYHYDLCSKSSKILQTPLKDSYEELQDSFEPENNVKKVSRNIGLTSSIVTFKNVEFYDDIHWSKKRII